MSKNINELFERYAKHAARWFPQKKRPEMYREITARLHDSLEIKQQSETDVSAETHAFAVMQEAGRPEEMARTYQGDRYLISPRMYSAFEAGLKILGIVLLVVLGVTLGASMLGRTGAPFGILLNTLAVGGNMWGLALKGFGMLVLIFMIIDRVSYDSAKTFSLEDETEAWDPHSLTNEAEMDMVYPIKKWVETAFAIIGLIWINGFPDTVGIWVWESGVHNGVNEGVFIPMLGEGFFQILPLINFAVLTKIVFNIYLIKKDAYSNALRYSEIAIEILGIMILYLLFTTNQVIATVRVISRLSETVPSIAETLGGVLSWSNQVGIGIAFMVIVIIFVIEKINMFRSRVTI